MNEEIRSSFADAEWKGLRNEMEGELNRILDYWETHSVDSERGGFFGRIDENNKVYANAPRGSVLNARILWAFSAAFRHTKKPEHLKLASRAFDYIRDFLRDKEYGGLYWSVDYRGQPLETHKQVYAQAFGIYAMSEYFRVSGSLEALEMAQDWHHLIENYARDRKQGGYIDAFARHWGPLDNKKLSEKDENAPKTMNTHLHVVEAYANLFEVWPDKTLRSDILELLTLFDQRIIDKKTAHLGLFFTEGWQTETTLISYGHDIEAGWLLQNCAESVADRAAIFRAGENAIRITDAAMEGLDADGGLWYEYDVLEGRTIPEKHWWPQAEALVGLCNAWQLTKDSKYPEALLKNWAFIRAHILDKEKGEWFWGVDEKENRMTGQDKIGIWKCPYHNTRACLELIRRLPLSQSL